VLSFLAPYRRLIALLSVALLALTLLLRLPPSSSPSGGACTRPKP